MAKSKVFLSYSRKDQRTLDDLEKHLRALFPGDPSPIWVDHKIASGELWDEEIRRNLRDSRLTVFLVSPDFLLTDYVRTTELRIAFDEWANGRMHIAWMVVRPAAVETIVMAVPHPDGRQRKMKLTDFQALARMHAVPDGRGKSRDEHLLAVAREIAAQSARPLPFEIPPAFHDRHRVTIEFDVVGDRPKMSYVFGRDTTAPSAVAQSTETVKQWKKKTPTFEMLFPPTKDNPWQRLVERITHDKSSRRPLELLLRVVLRARTAAARELMLLPWEETIFESGGQSSSLRPSWTFERSCGSVDGVVYLPERPIVAAACFHADDALGLSKVANQIAALKNRPGVVEFESIRLSRREDVERCRSKVDVVCIHAQARVTRDVLEIKFDDGEYRPIHAAIPGHPSIVILQLVGNDDVEDYIPASDLVRPRLCIISRIGRSNSPTDDDVKVASDRVRTLLSRLLDARPGIKDPLANIQELPLARELRFWSSFDAFVPTIRADLPRKSRKSITAEPARVTLDRENQRGQVAAAYKRLIDHEELCGIVVLGCGFPENHVELLGRQSLHAIREQDDGSKAVWDNVVIKEPQLVRLTKTQLVDLCTHQLSVESHGNLRDVLGQRLNSESTLTVLIMDWGKLLAGTEGARKELEQFVDHWCRFHKDELLAARPSGLKFLSILGVEMTDDQLRAFKTGPVAKLRAHLYSADFDILQLEPMDDVDLYFIVKCLSSHGCPEYARTALADLIHTVHRGKFEPTARCIEDLLDSFWSDDAIEDLRRKLPKSEQNGG